MFIYTLIFKIMFLDLPTKKLQQTATFITTVPHQKITTDTTEFKYYEIDEKGRMVIKKLYLDPFLDMYNGEIISYGISKTPSAISVLSAQKKAIEITSDCPYRRTFHSDRGWA